MKHNKINKAFDDLKKAIKKDKGFTGLTISSTTTKGKEEVSFTREDILGGNKNG